MKARSDFRVRFGKSFDYSPVRWMFCTAILLTLLIFSRSTKAMTDDSEMSPTGAGKFSLFWSSGHDWGSREISFDGDHRLYYTIGDTLNNDSETGVGAFELILQNADVAEMKTAGQVLCDLNIQKGEHETTDPSATFSVYCREGGQVVIKNGSLRLIPDNLQSKLYSVTSKYSDRAYAEGKKIIKLDFSTYKIERKDGGYVISVQFINSGQQWIKFKTPDQWPGNTIYGDLGVAPARKITGDGENDKSTIDWGFGLAGKKLLNRDEFPDGVVTLNPGEGKILKFQTIPDNKISKGEYEFSGAAFMNIEFERRAAALSGRVILSPIKTRITIDRDYPTTPQEREQWEATHRANMSYRPIKPGKTFAENGLYRAVRTTSSTHRSLQLVPFKAGDVATTDSVKMLMERGNGISLDGPVQWLWEGSAPTPVKQYSFDTIEETRQFCEPGSACPRSGRWLPRIREGWDKGHRYDLAGIVTLRRGQPMPSIRDAGEQADWEWLGV